MKKMGPEFDDAEKKEKKSFSIYHLLIGLVIAFTVGFFVSDAFPKDQKDIQVSIDAAYSSGLEEGKAAAEGALASKLETQKAKLETQTKEARQEGYEQGYEEGQKTGAKEAEARLSSQAEAAKAQSEEKSAPAAVSPTPTPEPPAPTEAPQEVAAPPVEPQADMVWIPTHGGKKYHSSSTCSKMKDPAHVTREEAEMEGFTPCKKCYG